MKIDFNLLRKEKTKRYVLAGYFLVFLLYVFVWIFSSLLKFNLTMEPIFYWILFVGLILIGILLKPKSGLYLWMGFALFISGVFLFFLTFKNASEFLFRNASLLFLYGTILSLIEYRKDAKKEKKRKRVFEVLSNLFFVLVIFLLLGVFLFLLASHQGFAAKVVNISFLFLLVGCIFYILNIKYE